MSRLREVGAFVPRCAVLMRRLASDPRVPRRHKWMLGGVAAYLASPIDLIPDFLPVVGHVDDALVVVLALRAIVRSAGPELVAELWPGSEQSLATVLRLAGAPAPAQLGGPPRNAADAIR